MSTHSHSNPSSAFKLNSIRSDIFLCVSIISRIRNILENPTENMSNSLNADDHTVHNEHVPPHLMKVAISVPFVVFKSESALDERQDLMETWSLLSNAAEECQVMYVEGEKFFFFF